MRHRAERDSPATSVASSGLQPRLGMSELPSRERLFQVRLMLRDAESRVADGDRLNSDLGRRSDSGYLLRLLGFELLLKACVRLHVGAVKPNHSYLEFWCRLPQVVQQRIATAAQLRMAGHSDYSDLPGLLTTWSRNFVRLRYSYEVYEGQTADDYHARGEAWLARGAPEAEADFVYYPNELRGLIDALLEELRSEVGPPV